MPGLYILELFISVRPNGLLVLSPIRRSILEELDRPR